MDRLVIPIIVVIFFTLNIGFFSANSRAHRLQINTNDGPISYQVKWATTPEAQQRGLMFKKNLEEDKGMLFVYDQVGTPYFWMKNMNFPIDILFIDKNKKIRKIIHSAPVCEKEAHCPTYSHEGEIKYVLEISAGQAKKHNITEGQSININEN